MVPPQWRGWVVPLGLRDRWQLLVLALLFAVALVARTVDVADNPRGFFTDEASFGLNAHLILTTAHDEHGAFLPFLFRSFGEYKLPAFVYAEVPFIALLGKTELAVRFTAALLGSLTIASLYLLAREIFRRELPALGAAACLAILPWHIHYSRTGLGDIVILPWVFTVAWYLFLRATRDQRFLLPAAIALAAVLYTYRGGWVVMPPLLLVMSWAYRTELLQYRLAAARAAAAFAIILIPLAWHLLSDSGDRSSQAWIFRLDPEQGILRLFWDFYKSYFSSAFLFEQADAGAITRHYLPDQGVLYAAQAPFLLLGIVALLTRLRRPYLIVLSLVLLFPLSGALSDTSPISSRTILGSVTASLLTGAGIWLLVELIGRLLRPPARLAATAAAIGVIIGLAGVSFGSYLSSYHSNYPALSAGYWGWQDGPQEIIDRFLLVQDEFDDLYMDGDFNAPRIFFEFYAGSSCRKCRIGGTDRYDPARRQLFALRPENISSTVFEYNVMETLYYPDGQPSFFLLEITGQR